MNCSPILFRSLFTLSIMRMTTLDPVGIVQPVVAAFEDVGCVTRSVFGSNREVRRAASPLFHVKPGAPPFLVTYCQWDYYSLPAQAREFHHALEQAGIKTELIYIPRENHISEMLNVSQEDNLLATATLKFMNP